MIQRIQTLFMVIALILMGLMIWLPLGEIAINDKIYSFSIIGIVDILTGQTVYSAWHLLVLIVGVLLLQVIAIFSYKKRKKQMRIVAVNCLLMLGFAIASWLFIMLSAKTLGNGIYSSKIVIPFSLISIIMNYLAVRAIKRDEDLVRSVDRIR